MIEAVVVGRVGVDFTPASPRTSLADAESFIRAVGGFAGNIGTGLARLGISTAVVSGVGDDGHGDHVRTGLAAEGIDVDALTTRAGSRTQVAFFEAWPPEHFPVTFYRPDPPPDTQLTIGDVPLAALEGLRLVIVSGALLARLNQPVPRPSRSSGARLAARSRRVASWTILDLDWRPTLWADPGEYPALIERAAGLSDVLIGSDAEFAAAGLEPSAGPAGGPGITSSSTARTGCPLLTGGTRRSLPGIAVEVTCGLGAGDALSAAFAAGLLRGLEPLVALERGNAAGAIVASAAHVQHGDAHPGRDRRAAPRQPDRRCGGAAMTTPREPAEVTIHPAKLPSRLPPEMLHIKPGADGVVATNPARSGWRYLSFRSFGLAEGEVALLDSPDQRRRSSRSRAAAWRSPSITGAAWFWPAGHRSSRACRGAPTSRPGRRPGSSAVRCPARRPWWPSPRRP